VVASPGDVQSERNLLAGVVEEVNRNIAADRNLRLELSRWETDTYPAFHVDGPQGVIDPILRIDDCDVLIGIFWKRFGTPLKDAKSGTEHEFNRAYEAWKINGRPQIMVYFNQRSSSPASEEEVQQWGQVIAFRSRFPTEGLWRPYRGKVEFEALVRNHLTAFIRQNFGFIQPPFGEASGASGSRLTIQSTGDDNVPLEPGNSSALFSSLYAAIARSDEEIFRTAFTGFLTFPGSDKNRGLILDVLGATSSGTDRAHNSEKLQELAAQLLLAAIARPEPASLAAVEYLRWMPRYFKVPPACISKGPMSASVVTRIGSNLCLRFFRLSADSTDATAVLPDRTRPLALRVASALLLGAMGHVEANDILSETANGLAAEHPALQEAVAEGLYLVGENAAPSQTLEGLRAAFSTSTVVEVRGSCAKRFLEIMATLDPQAKRTYRDGAAAAQEIVASPTKPASAIED